VSRAVAVAQGGGARPLRVGAVLAGVVLAAVLLFSLGVMTGARIALRAPDHPEAAAPATPAVSAPPPAATAVPPGSLTFYDRRSGAAVPRPPVQHDEPADQSAPGTAAAPEAPAPAPPAATPAERQTAAKRETGPAAAKPLEAARPSGGDAAARVKNLMGRGPYAVQVAAVTDRASAAALAERLRRQGLPATTVTATSKGKTWYRLRVGSFPSREAAVRAAGLLHAELGLEATPVRD